MRTDERNVLMNSKTSTYILAELHKRISKINSSYEKKISESQYDRNKTKLIKEQVEFIISLLNIIDYAMLTTEKTLGID
ncbi:MAG: hypothetical protein HUU54_02635 [Ignavibacteriaceae bacterium]|nr:hypothetical protein [Ignavibacteriaceae bacterium]